MLPNFLGIGAQRCGTSWLHSCLSKHPQIYLPTARKEVHFFDSSFERGIDWYRKFFSGANSSHLAVGEITPKYILHSPCRDRIRSVLGNEVKFLVLLRNPVHRAFSQYTAFSESAGQEPVSFSQFLKSHPDAISRGEYFRQLSFFAEVFPRNSFLVLIHEEIHRSPDSEISALQAVCRHLGVNAEPVVRSGPVGKSLGQPRSRWLTRHIFNLRDWFRRRDMDFLINIAKRSGVKRLLYSGASDKSKISQQDHEQLLEYYREDTAQLESWLGCSLDIWRA